LSGAPYGYRYIKKEEGGGAARFEIMLDEARVCRVRSARSVELPELLLEVQAWTGFAWD
jgi:hypothetical protein